ncbi:MAG: hypothetical protein KGO80_09065, partial [Bacteroidetes bacterium]|nr:hypothetical protein [Bacteroidota bacterium]
TKATGIGTATSLPAGVTAAWSDNVITISGTPTATGPFNYTIPLTGGGCGTVNATGTITVTAAPSACTTPIVTDIDGNIYNTVSIGTQCWMMENLRLSSYNDGTLIPIVTNGSPWGMLTTGGRSWYNNDSTANEIPYGNLYNWYAMKGIASVGSTTYKNICPIGWHVPTSSDWDKLAIKLGGSSKASGKMKSTDSTYWDAPNTDATNESDFSTLPGGGRNDEGRFYGIRVGASFWSATEGILIGFAECRDLSTRDGNLYSDGGVPKSYGKSVRCLRD